MAASANPSGKNQEGSANGNGATNNGSAVTHDSAVVGPTQAALRHNPGLAVEWTADEQSLLDELLPKFASERNIVRYAKIAMQLKDKTVRDVALRCRWLTKKENGKRRKEDHNLSRKSKDKKEKVSDPTAKSASHVVNRSNGPPYAQSVISMDSDDGISYEAPPPYPALGHREGGKSWDVRRSSQDSNPRHWGCQRMRRPPFATAPYAPGASFSPSIGGVTGQLLEQNAQALDQISANFGVFKIHENVNLFCQARNNILAILNDSNDIPDVMKQMPPLPVNLNEELANSILPQSLLQKNL